MNYKFQTKLRVSLLFFNKQRLKRFIHSTVHSCGHQMTKVLQPEEFITAT